MRIRTMFRNGSVLFIAIVIVSCVGVFEAEQDVATVTIDVDNDSLPRTIIPDIGAMIDAFEVTLSRDGYDDRTANGVSGPFSFDSVESGLWTVTVHALVEGAIVGVGSGEIDVSPSGSNTISVAVSATQSGEGSLDLTIQWPSGFIDTVHSAFLEAEGEPAIDISDDFVDGTNSTRYMTTRSSAVYKLDVSFGYNGSTVAHLIEYVHLFDNVTTTETIVLDETEIGTVPAPPDGLVATSSSNDSITLSWNDNSNTEEGYRVERATTSGGPYSVVSGELEPNTTSYSDAGLAEGTTYYYQVVAFNSFGQSDPSNTASAMPTGLNVIIADHTVVDLYGEIPQYWIDQVKQMLVVIPGESHGRGIIYGLELLAADDPNYAIDPTWFGAPEGPTTDHLRLARTFWDGSNWHDWGGEEDFWTSEAARTTMRSNFDYMQDNQSNPIDALGFGWCWDMTWLNGPQGEADPVYDVRWSGSTVGGPDGNLPWGLDSDDSSLTTNSVNLQTYLSAVDSYNAHDSESVTFFSTGPVDRDSAALSPANSEASYARYLKHQAIRDYVAANGGVLFDYADILSWEAGQQYTEEWQGHAYPTGVPTLATGGAGYGGTNPGVHERADGDSHISEEACLRLGKAMWWMLARLAGWNGIPE